MPLTTHWPVENGVHQACISSSNNREEETNPNGFSKRTKDFTTFLKSGYGHFYCRFKRRELPFNLSWIYFVTFVHVYFPM